MPRAARIVVPGVSHHITQRGNDRQDVFFKDRDRRAYLEILCEQSARHEFNVEAYCLMDNHVHIIGVPLTESSLAKAIGRTNFIYAQYVNETYGRSGHLWQNRYYSCPMDPAHAINAMIYVELNPVRAGIIADPLRYRWSSAIAHCSVNGGSRILNLALWRNTMGADYWRRTLADATERLPDFEELRRYTLTGRPLGNESFLMRIENALGRSVRHRPAGRPLRNK